MKGFSIRDIEVFAEMMYSRPIDDLYLVPYSYPINFENVADNATASGILTLSANADFIALGLRHFNASESTFTIMSKQAGDLRCLITDTSSGDQFTNGSVILENWGSNGTGEILFDFPRLLAGRTALSVQLTNLTGLTSIVTQLELHGVLVRAWSDRPTPAQLKGA